MSYSQMSRRIFGGKEPQPTTGAGQYQRALYNETSDQTDAETLIVGTTARVFPGPRRGGSGAGGSGVWSYHVNNLTVSGATSALKFYYSNLPNPDPTNAAHWKDSGITAIDLTAVAASFATQAGAFPLWIKAEAVTVTSAGTLWAYVHVDGEIA